MKKILIDTLDGQYILPINLVAEHRADYYACEVDGHEKNSPEWQEEVDWVIEDDFEAIDWLLNNTNYEDWEDFTTKLNSDVKVTMYDFWTSSENFKIID